MAKTKHQGIEDRWTDPDRRGKGRRYRLRRIVREETTKAIKASRRGGGQESGA